MSVEHRHLWRILFDACGSHLKAGVRILDFGCGDGSMLSYLLGGDGRAWRGVRCALALGIDLPGMAPVLTEAATRSADGSPLLFSSSPPDAFPMQFDLILSHEVIYLLPDLQASFRELHAALKPGGLAFLATGCHLENELYPRWQDEFARHGVPACPYRTEDYVEALRAAGFEEIDCRRIRLTAGDYEEWVRMREDPSPNASWFRDAAEERHYYTETGKILLVARRPGLERQGTLLDGGSS